MDRVEDGAIAFASPSARRIAACFSPSAVSTAACFCALGGQDLRLLLALGGEDRGAAVALGAHLLLHRLLDVPRRVDRLDLDAVDADPPLAGRLVEHAAQLGVDVLAAGQRVLERQRRRSRCAASSPSAARSPAAGWRSRRWPTAASVTVKYRTVSICDDDVVLGDHRLGREVDDLLAQVDQRLQRSMNGMRIVRPGLERAAVAAEALDDAGPRLGIDRGSCARTTISRNDDHDDRDDCSEPWPSAPIRLTSAVAPLISTTSTRSPALDHLVVVVAARGPHLARRSSRSRRPRRWRSARARSPACRRAPRRRSGSAAACAGGGGRSGAATEQRSARDRRRTRSQEQRRPRRAGSTTAASAAPTANGAR